MERDQLTEVIDNSVYTDPAVYARETEAIFHSTWQFACHGSEVREPGSFRTLLIAGEPILVVRDQSGDLRAFYNVCRHRGSIVVQEESGKARKFRCPYHWWTYELSGELTGIPEAQVYDATENWFERSNFGLVPVAVDECLGLVFVCLARQHPGDLRTFLGGVVDALQPSLESAELEVFAREVWPVACNWKAWVENSRDGYHALYVHHETFRKLSAKPLQYEVFENAHAIQYIDTGEIDGDFKRELLKNPLPGIRPGSGYVAQLYPQLGIAFRNSFIEIDVARPLGVDSIELELLAIGVRGDEAEVRKNREDSWRRWVHYPATQEDIPAVVAQQRGLSARSYPHASLINRGAAARTGLRGDDNRLRYFWERWREDMGEDLNSIHPAFRTVARSLIG